MRDIISDENFFKIENLQPKENNDEKTYLIMRNDIAVFIDSHNKINHIVFSENNSDIRKDVFKKIKNIKNLEMFPYGSLGKDFINQIKSLNFDNLFIHELIENKDTVFNSFFKKAKKFYTEHENKRNMEKEKTTNQTINPLEYFFTIKNEIFLNTIMNKRFIDILNLKQPFNANYVIVNQNEAFFFNDKIVKKIYCHKDLKIGNDFVQFMKNHKNIQCFLSPDCSDLKDKIYNSSIITQEQNERLNTYSKRIHGVIKKHIDRIYKIKSDKSEKKGISNFFSEAYDFKSERKLSYQDFEKQLKNIYYNKDKFLNKEVDTNYSPNVFIKNNLAIFMDHGKIRHIIYGDNFFEKLKNDLNNYKNINIVADKNVDLFYLNQSLNKNVNKVFSLVDKEKIFSIIDYGVRKHVLNNKNNFENFNYMTMKDTINSIQHSENWKKNKVSFYKKNQSDIINLSGYIMTNEMISKNDNDTYIIYSDGSLSNNIPIHSQAIETFNMGCSFLTYRINEKNEIDLYQYGFCGASYNGKSSSELAEQIALDMSHLSKDVVRKFIHYLDNLSVVNENPFCLHTKGHVKQNDIYNQNGANELTDYLAKKVRKKNKITPEEIIESFNNFNKPLKQEEVISSLQFVQ